MKLNVACEITIQENIYEAIKMGESIFTTRNRKLRKLGVGGFEFIFKSTRTGVEYLISQNYNYVSSRPTYYALVNGKYIELDKNMEGPWTEDIMAEMKTMRRKIIKLERRAKNKKIMEQKEDTRKRISEMQSIKDLYTK